MRAFCADDVKISAKRCVHGADRFVFEERERVACKIPSSRLAIQNITKSNTF